MEQESLQARPSAASRKVSRPRVRRLPQHAPLAFTRCVVLYNPISTQAKQAYYRIEDLQTLFPGGTCTLVETSAEGRAANVDLLFEHADLLGAKTLLAIVAGDGTVNLVVDALLRDPRSNDTLRKTTVLPFWGGNANDLAHMINGPSRRISTRRLLEQGKQLAVRPLYCTFVSPQHHGESNTQVQTAVCYASFGASAYAAYQLEKVRGHKFRSHAFRATKFTHELGMVIKAMAKAPLFSIEDNDEVRSVYERIFVNGSRFAKVAGVSLKLTDEAFCQSLVYEKKLSEVTTHIMELARKSTVPQTMHHEPVSFTLHEATWAQIDGEVTRLKAGTQVTVARAPDQFYVWSTLLTGRAAEHA